MVRVGEVLNLPIFLVLIDGRVFEELARQPLLEIVVESLSELKLLLHLCVLLREAGQFVRERKVDHVSNFDVRELNEVLVTELQLLEVFLLEESVPQLVLDEVASQ